MAWYLFISVLKIIINFLCPESNPPAQEITNSEDVTTGDDGVSSSIAPGSTYEVFLSFRGADNRLSFTDHLYWNLTGAGIRTFRDNEGLHVGKGIGPDLIKAIEESSISIPIFSKDYASSKWCLREVTHMVKCMNDKDPEGRQRHTVCPIFYDVTPEDVKRQTGSFAEAFVKHTKDKKVDASTVQEWKDALKEVGKLKGWEKDKIANGHEAELIKEIVTKVCKMLKKGHVSLTDNLVGMDHHIEEMTKLLDNDGNGVGIVGIVGLGGIGKTTIAKFMYNKLCDQFQPHCFFLEDVRERVKHNNGCAELRKQLISDVLKRPVDEIKIDKDIFRDKKVLIVLDDVEERSQLKEIIGGREYFGSGSRIIVTTRDKDIFVKSKGDLIYEPSGMDSDDSLLLFCKYAFESTQPWKGYEEISRKVTKTAAGLPLSLVVIGSMLFSKESMKYWEDTLEKLKKIPAEEVQKRLKISYDALNHEQKQIFLDIACHFIGEDQTLPCYMWKDCDFYPGREIDNLVYLSLITIGEGNFFRMHDQLRDLGRYIVNQNNPDESKERGSRLWSQKEAVDTLKERSGTKIVQTLSMNYGSDYDCIISSDDFNGLSRLRYLCLVGPRMEGNFNRLVSNLRWFRWRFKDSTDALEKSIMPITNFHANKLVILDLSGSDIRDGWESWIQIKEAINLKVLNLSECRYLTMLPECIGNLTNLIKLLLSRSMIKRLPDAIGKLKKLEVLDCCECSSLDGQLHNGIGKLSYLRVINLFRTQVDKLPKNVGSLCNLRKLYLSGTHIKKLPGMGIEKLQNLEELNCSHCAYLDGQLLEGIWRLSSLRALNLSFTKADRFLKNVVRLCNSRNLNLSDTDIKMLTGVSYEMLQKLKDLNYYPWPLKRELTDAIERLSSLRVLDKIADSSTQERSNLEMKRKLEDVTTVDDGASSSTTSGSTYEVFLSFRGADNPRSFTNHLYISLTGAGIRTFRDNEEFCVGKEIVSGLMKSQHQQKAMEESSISIPIFSKKYASSEWCLMELTHMVKCMKSYNGHTICPIFYDVTPFEVRHQTGSFAEAFLQHTKKFDKPIVQEWMEALTEVSQLKRWEKDKIADGNEDKLVDEIVTEVRKMLKKSNVSLTDNLVGMDHHREEMTKLLDIGSNGVRIVGIVGMGGIGKTTIAKFMYNKLCYQFQPQCSFLEDVRERVKSKNGCAELRKQLISDVLKRTVDGSTIDEDIFRAKKVLIVLDDVGNKSQLKEIIGGHDCFGSGSRIIVTTRNKDVFVKKEGDLIYEPGEMNYDDSLLLFCKHAFQKAQPEEGFEEISRKVVQTATGLPLSLVVIGSMLFSKESMKYWEDTLEKLKKIPAQDVQKKLKISYDALDHGRNQIFLDIACHFTGEDQTLPCYMWEDCSGLHPSREIDNLVYLSLITIGEGNVFRMHDQVRDLGRYIVNRNKPDASEERGSSPWSREETVDTLKKRLGKEKVQTLHVEYDGGSYCHTDNDFRGRSSDSPVAVTNFCHRTLVILDLLQSDIRDGWERWIQIKQQLTNLKVLDLSYCPELTKTPDFSTLWSLERLNLQGCENLTEIGSSVKHLKRLTYFNAKFCPRLRKLPPEFGSMASLQDVHLDSNTGGIDELPNLETLDLGFCPKLQLPVEGLKLPLSLIDLSIPLTEASFKGVRGLVNLRDLEFYKNVGYSCEPVAEEVGEIAANHSNNLLLPIIDMPSNLEYLTLRGLDDEVVSCRLLPAMKFDSSSRLKVLKFSDCTFGTLPIGSLDLSGCQMLKQLEIENCRDMREIADFSSLLGSIWKRISISSCQSLEVLQLSDLSSLKRLEMLSIRSCPKLSEIKGLQVSTSLECLTVSDCPLLKKPDLSNLKGLETVIWEEGSSSAYEMNSDTDVSE